MALSLERKTSQGEGGVEHTFWPTGETVKHITCDCSTIQTYTDGRSEFAYCAICDEEFTVYRTPQSRKALV